MPILLCTKKEVIEPLFRGATENRTRDTRIFSPLLYQLSYGTLLFLKAATKVLLFFDMTKFFCVFFAFLVKKEYLCTKFEVFMQLKVIAYARNGHSDKFGIPRQSRDESPIVTRIVFEPEYSVKEALRGLEGFSHLWLIWGFSENEKKKDEDERSWSPTVRPPRLGGNKRMGVFATRSPFRPNPLGLSSVRLIGVKSQESGNKTLELIVSGADLLDGTPIYDIKPYLSFSDCHPDAQNGFAEETKNRTFQVVWEPALDQHLHSTCIGHDKVSEISYILSQDPRPGYQDDPSREYKMDYAGYTVTFSVNEQTVYVKNIEKKPFL